MYYFALMLGSYGNASYMLNADVAVSGKVSLVSKFFYLIIYYTELIHIHLQCVLC